MNSALIIGGASGIGLAVALKFAKICREVFIIDRHEIGCEESIPDNVMFIKEDLTTTDFEWLNQFKNIDILFYSAGFGRVAPFESLNFKEIDNLFKVNTIGAIKVLNYYMPIIKSEKTFLCGLMVSIAGRLVSPLFSVYSATKSALYRGIEAINAELRISGTSNRILDVSPGSIKGTSFGGQKTNLEALERLSNTIVNSMLNHEEFLIPEFEDIYKNVLQRYQADPIQFAQDSYNYKIESNRIQEKPQITIGYLSGTFDLFHVGHLNLLRRARRECDYLVVGVHKDASHKGKETFIPFEERMEILKNIKFVDKVIESEKEDSDVYKKGIVKYDKLFVGSDYKGSERFNQYERFFKDKGVEIIYFPYTKGTSSTQLRENIKIKNRD